MPVSEDADGVYYHAVKGVITGRPNPPYEHEMTTGGVYFSKTKPGVAHAYVGDARQPTAHLRQGSERLRKEALQKFLVARAAPKSRK